MESEARYRAIFDLASDAIFLHDPDTGAILDVNRRMTEMYGYTREEALRLSVSDLSAGEQAATQARALQLARGTGLGLPTAKRLVEAHHGRLHVQCPADGGTIVTIELPQE